MAPSRISASSHTIPVTNLSPAAFAPFGQVIQNPGTHKGEPALDTVEANQGSATKWLDVSQMQNLYSHGKSGREAKCVMNMFVCRPRRLRDGRLFKVGILERHPYTPQTFVPMGLGKADKKTAYLVVVAPTLPPEAWKDNSLQGTAVFERQASQGVIQKGPGPPDLANLRAFIARGDQAVRYGPGTWHAPMVVLGEKEIEFVVVQYANGVAEEDCQEVEIDIARGEGVEVDVGMASEDRGRGRKRANL